ncbi:DUF2256 domain-containing protein [Mycolicibacterium bacteremicum]|uniref:DUF2256 domain-containing protein n=1 Tax=Mycolicibacterium bacteremicum TaxID=564198 RepID=UPI0026EB90D4|nr:DUF2256 domain-containing protein [Mycolicibacterium bacteremicum]
MRIPRLDTTPGGYTSATGAGEENEALGKNTEVKICATCGRPFHNRKKWSSRGQWEQIRYCSRRCRGAAS